ncbi:MAG: hypothetical protein IPK21_18485 [Haliscomenobacter sp.]|nr:hypothetical protein [Haliscomenobacter sp.]
MAATFQKTLYRQQGAQWRYTRLRWLESAPYFEVQAAPCGQPAKAIGQEWLRPGESREEALHRLALPLRQAGWLEMPVLEWHLDLTVTTPAFDGLMAAAPWFDAFHAGLLYPLLFELGETANYGHWGGTRQEDNRVTYFLWTVNPEAAEAIVRSVGRNAPAGFEVSARIRQRGEDPSPRAHTTDASWEMRSVLGFENHLISATEKWQYERSLPENQPISEIIRPDAGYPCLPNLGPDRVTGANAEQLRQHLRTLWQVGKDRWPPLGAPVSHDVLYLEGAPEEEVTAQLTGLLQQKATGTVYVFDTEEGIFSSAIGQIFPDVAQEDTYWFDERMEWIIYKSHHNTLTFGGDWLIKKVRDLFHETPERLFPLPGTQRNK